MPGRSWTGPTARDRVSSTPSTRPSPCIGAIYAVEIVIAHNANVASPIEVQEFWEKYGELPGFALAPEVDALETCGSLAVPSIRPSKRPRSPG
jgi:hypothetical protein